METQENIPDQTVAKKAGPLKYIIIGLIAIGVIYFAIVKIHHALYYESTDNAQIQSNAIPVLSRASGFIADFNIKDYQDVIKDSVLLTIEDKGYKIAVQQAEADLLAAKADLTNAESQINTIASNEDVANAQVSIEQVALQKAKTDLNRNQSLFDDGSITQHQLDDSKSNYESAIKQVGSSRSKVRQAGTQTSTANAQIDRSKANVAVKESILQTARLNLSYTRILAPATGKIGETNLHPGQFVQAGQQLFSVINNKHFWVVANFKETQIEHLHVGQDVKVQIDEYPDKDITGTISALSAATGAQFSLLPADNSTGNFVKVTQRVPVKIELNDSKELLSILKAGLSVTVEVKVK